MFWSYIGNFKIILGLLQNQRALLRLEEIIHYQKAKSANGAFNSLVKSRYYSDLNEYITSDKEGWRFSLPFGGSVYFYNNIDMETFHLTIKHTLVEQTVFILSYLGIYHIKLDMFDMESDRYELPKKEEVKSKWYWFRQVFLSEPFLLFLFIFGGIIFSFISAIYGE